jgi:glyoxylase-like metal-dependent hydrolase (beta-lactamase superfamily II)
MQPTRRRFSGALVAASLGGLASACGQLPTNTPAQPDLSPGTLVALADGVYMVAGSGGEAEPANRGRVGNTGFVVGSEGVVVIDTGTSYRHGRDLIGQVRRVTDRPIRLALLTHVRQEFLFGVAAFREQGIAVRAHRDTADLMIARCDNCLKTLRVLLGADEMAATELLRPDDVFDGSHEVAQIGHPVRVLHLGHSSGPGDIAVFDERSRVLFAGGLMDERRIPDIQDAEPEGWRKALSALDALRVGAVVGGHGPATTAALISTTRRYLDQLEARIRTLLEQGVALSEVPDAAVLDEFSGWDQVDTIHRRNASVMFLRLEREWNFR